MNYSNHDLIKSVEERLRENHRSNKKNIIIELHLTGQFPYVKDIYEALLKEKSFEVYFSLLDDEFERIKSYLDKFGINEDRVFACSIVPSLKSVDLFLSPTNWTTFIPRTDIPKVQLFHSLIYKKAIFAGQFNDFNHILFPGKYHRDYYDNDYLKQYPDLVNSQKTYNVGYPKLDKLINNEIDIDKIKDELNLDKSKPTIIYAPTWDLTASLHNNGLKIISMIAEMDVNFLVKLHPMSYRDPKFTFASGGIDWTKELAFFENKYSNLRHILDANANPYLAASDLMVTDASGVGLEFMTLNKPLAFIDVPEFFNEMGKEGVEYKCRVAGEIISDIGKLTKTIRENLDNPGKFEKQRKDFSKELLYNPGKATREAVGLIKDLLVSRSKEPLFVESKENLFSIVIPSYNGKDMLKECIESIEANTLEKHEIIVVDDGSTDGTQQLFEHNSKVKCISFSSHQGAQAARNKGISQSTGNFIVFMDNDVKVTPCWLTNMSRALEETGSALAGPLANFARSEQLTLKSKKTSQDAGGSVILLDTFCLLVKREVVEKIGGFDPELEGEWAAEDFSLRAKLAGFSRIIVENVQIFHKGNKSHATFGDVVEMAHTAWEHFKNKWDIPAGRLIINGFDAEVIKKYKFEPSKHKVDFNLEGNQSNAHQMTHFRVIETDEIISRLERLPDKQKAEVLYSAIPNLCTGDVLEIGSKTFELAQIIAAGGFDITRVVSSRDLAEKERRAPIRALLDNLHIEVFDQKIPFGSDIFQTAVISINNLEDIDMFSELFEEISRVTVNSGIIVVISDTSFAIPGDVKSKIEEAITGHSSKFEKYLKIPKQWLVYSMENQKDAGPATEKTVIKNDEVKKYTGDLVSVIFLLKKDGQETLEAAIETVVNQSYQNIEILVCDTVGPDFIYKAGFLKDRIQYIDCTGLNDAQALNKGAQSSSGKFLTFLTGRDYLLPKSLEVKVRAMSELPHLELVHSDFYYFIGDKQGIRFKWEAPQIKTINGAENLLVGNKIHLSTVLIKKEAFNRLKFFNEDYEHEYFYDFILRGIVYDLKLKEVNIPTVWHKMDETEHSVYYREPDKFEKNIPVISPKEDIRIIKNIADNYGLQDIFPAIKKATVQKESITATYHIYRASVLFQRKLLDDAFKDIESAVRHKINDKLIINDLLEFAGLLLEESVREEDAQLVKGISSLILGMDKSIDEARLFSSVFELEEIFKDYNKDQKQIKKILDIAAKFLKIENLKKNHEYLYYGFGLIAYLLGDSVLAVKLYDKSVSVNPAFSRAKINKKIAEQLPLDKSGNSSVTKEIENTLDKLRATIKKNTLSLVMIVKDEEEYLEKCLASVKGIADEIVVVDTGSVDRTVEIAKNYGAKVVFHKWENDFAKARNVSIDNASGDWVMFLDADEELSEGSKELLLQLKDDAASEGFQFILNSYVGERVTEDSVINVALRMWRNRPQHRFRSALHEQIIDRVLKSGRVNVVNVQINHYGYMNKPTLSKSKSQRNLEIVKKMVEDEPENAFNHFSLGMEFARLVDWENASLAFEKSAEILGEHVEPYYAHVLALNRVRCLRNLNKFEQALDLINRLQLRYPNFPDLYLNQALVLFDAGDLNTAANVLKELTNLSPDFSKYATQSGITTFRPYFMLGLIYERIGDDKQAVHWYSRALKTSKLINEYTKNLIKLLLTSEKEEDVEDYILKNVDPNDKYNLLEIGVSFLENKHPKTSLKYLKRAVEMDNQLPHINYYMGKTKMLLKKYDEALEYLSKISQTSEDYLPSRVELALLYILKRHYPEALKSLMDFADIDIYSSYKNVLERLIGVLEGKDQPAKQFDQTESNIFWQLLNQSIQFEDYELFEQALKLRTNLPVDDGLIALNLGKIYHDNRFEDLATEQFLDAMQKGYYDSESLAILGDTCIAKGLTEDAINFYQNSITLDPPIMKNFIKLSQLLMSSNMQSEAKEVLKQASAVFPDSEILKKATNVINLISAN